jgi:hypothetical protein
LLFCFSDMNEIMFLLCLRLLLACHYPGHHVNSSAVSSGSCMPCPSRSLFRLLAPTDWVSSLLNAPASSYWPALPVSASLNFLSQQLCDSSHLRAHVTPRAHVTSKEMLHSEEVSLQSQ